MAPPGFDEGRIGEGLPPPVNATSTVLNQLIDDERGIYRMKLDDRVVYMTIPAGTFDSDTMRMPFRLLPKLPELSQQDDWTKIVVDRNPNIGSLEIAISSDVLPAVPNVWHDQYIDVLDLSETTYLNSSVREVLYEGRPTIAKIAAWDWEIPRIVNETEVYYLLDQHQRKHLHQRPISPRFLAHLTENGRVVGMLLEKLEGRHASIDDLQSCLDTLKRFHELRLVHGDVNRHNFIIGEDGLAKLIDFEHVEDFDEEEARREVESLEAELREETGRGAAVEL
ncbi:hypothetical protein PRZ48_006403 [Zasmidium cellare]|uniref:Alpha-galactosidase A n=1 Tax=Zasmidium cellare TaxID=395010 RepID=A0ABR0ENY7_ZASCE|nr:hypothetical protein PRZ48_006403 [Zasmidium cellare]